jgi:beta-lactamase class A
MVFRRKLSCEKIEGDSMRRMNLSTFVRKNLAAFIALFFVTTAFAQTENPSSWQPGSSEKLQKILDAAVAKTFEKFPKLQTNEIAVTLVDLNNPEKPVQASFRGDVQIYPASVVKLFYLAATHQWLQDGKIQDREELRRAMRDMIVDSGNEPTHYIVDVLTDTTSGPELSDKEMEEWYFKRNAVNRYFQSLGYKNINVNRKPWGEGPYGRETQSIKITKPNHRNWLTTDATARLLSEIATGKAVSKSHSAEMMELLRRDMKSDTAQAREFSAPGLPEGAKLWSKAGWTSETRHDAAYVELPNGQKFVLVTFTVNHANDKGIIPTVARSVVEGFTQK